MKLRKQAHCVYQCEYHLVLVSKYRRKIFNAGSFGYFTELMKKLRDDLPEVDLISMNHDEDHIHMLVSIPPKLSVSSFMGYLKGKSALMIFDRHGNLKYKLGNRHFWSRGYYVSTVGLNEATIAKYVREQEKHDQLMERISTKEAEDPFRG